jgi:hypothetical protein
MTDRGEKSAHRALSNEVCRCDGGDDRQRPNTSRHLANLLQRRQGLAEQHLLRWSVAAMLRTIDEGPESTGLVGVILFTAKQARTNAEQDPAPKFQPFGSRFVPWKRLKQRQPRIFKLRQLRTRDASRQQFACHLLQPRFRRRRIGAVELLQPLSPPREANRAEPRIGARRDDVGKGKIEIPECGKGRSQRVRQLLQRDRAVVIEPSLSDSRRPSPPRPLATR